MTKKLEPAPAGPALTENKPKRLPKVTSAEGGAVHIEADPETLGDAFGTEIPAAGHALLDAVIRPVAQHGPEAMNVAVALVAELAPRDAAETMLATQAVTANRLAALLAGEALAPGAKPNRLGYAQAALNASKAVAQLLAALDKRKRGPVTTQRVVVERVNVSEGGQAIVGAVAGAANGGGDAR